MVTDAQIHNLLALKHNEDSPYVEFRLPVNPLIDKPHCESISDVLGDAGTQWTVRKATKEAYGTLPRTGGLYMFVWRPDITFSLATAPPEKQKFAYVLYVGKVGGVGSNNTLRDRYKAEYSRYVERDPKILWDRSTATGRAAVLRRYLTLIPLEYWYTEISDREKIDELERRLLWMFHPPLAQRHRARLASPQAAFKEH